MSDKPTPEQIVEYLERYHKDEWGNVLLNTCYWPQFKAWVDGDGPQPIGVAITATDLDPDDKVF